MRLCHLADTDLGLFGPVGFAAELQTRVDLSKTAKPRCPRGAARRRKQLISALLNCDDGDAAVSPPSYGHLVYFCVRGQPLRTRNYFYSLTRCFHYFGVAVAATSEEAVRPLVLFL